MKTFNTLNATCAYSVSNPLETVELKDYHYNGQLWEHSFFVDGKRHGECKLYYINGKLREHFFYVDGTTHGECKSYFSNGQLNVHYFFVNGEEINLDHLNDGSYKSLCILSTIFDRNVIDLYI